MNLIPTGIFNGDLYLAVQAGNLHLVNRRKFTVAQVSADYERRQAQADYNRQEIARWHQAAPASAAEASYVVTELLRWNRELDA